MTTVFEHLKNLHSVMRLVDSAHTEDYELAAMDWLEGVVEAGEEHLPPAFKQRP